MTRRLAVAFLLSLPAMAQTVAHRYPAGSDADGNQLTVIHLRYPKPAPDEKQCVPGEQYVLEKTRGGRKVSSEPIVTLCRTDDTADIGVTVKPNRIVVDRNGGAQAGYFKIHDYQLSPWRALGMEDCSFFASGEFTVEHWDYRALRGQAWHLPVDPSSEAGDYGICESNAKLFSYLMVPLVPLDTAPLELSRVRLGSCALTLDASGRNGLLTWGRADAQDPVEVKLLQTGEHTLLAQVIDPKRNTRPAKSWIAADHFEMWMGSRMAGAGPDEVWQFGIPVDEGPVQVGYGKPRQLPVVDRWSVRLADGRTAWVLRIGLPPQPADYADGLTVIYSQSLEGRAQKRMIATSRIRRGEATTMGAQHSTLDRNSAGDHVTCGVVNGALDVTGARKRPLEIPELPR